MSRFYNLYNWYTCTKSYASDIYKRWRYDNENVIDIRGYDEQLDDYDRYKFILDVRVITRGLEKWNEALIINEIINICKQGDLYLQKEEAEEEYDSWKIYNQEYETMSSYRAYKDEDEETTLREHPSHMDIYEETTLREHPSHMDKYEETTFLQRPRSFTDVMKGLRRVVLENKEDDDDELLGKLKAEIEGLDFKTFGQAALASKFATIGDAFRGLVDRYHNPRSYKFLHKDILSKMTRAMDELSMKGGYIRKHRFTHCKKHRHCRYCGKRHH